MPIGCATRPPMLPNAALTGVANALSHEFMTLAQPACTIRLGISGLRSQIPFSRLVNE